MMFYRGTIAPLCACNNDKNSSLENQQDILPKDRVTIVINKEKGIWKKSCAELPQN